MDDPNVYIAEVTPDGILDPTHSGELEVRILGCAAIPDKFIAKCAMPFGGNGSGFIGPVTPLSKVLVTKVIVSQPSFGPPVIDWFWLGVIPTTTQVRKDFDEIDITANIFETGVKQENANPEADKSYYGSDILQKVLIKSSMGHKLELSEKVLTLIDGVKHDEDYALLTTNIGKHIKLDAGVGPGMDRIIISDENDNRIVIKSGDDGDTPGPNSMVIECQGNMHLNSKSGEIVLNVEKDSTSKIQIINDGAGDINVEARHGDVYLGAVSDINLSASGTVNVHAEQDINLDANNDISINAGNQMTLTASRIDLNP
tara:strand:- start:25 stop:966 length:942 start_codon:yes stop_codon:yes gene_type:complete